MVSVDVGWLRNANSETSQLVVNSFGENSLRWIGIDPVLGTPKDINGPFSIVLVRSTYRDFYGEKETQK